MQNQDLFDLVSPHAEIRQVPAGTRFLAQGSAAETVLIVASGEVELVLPGIPPVVLDRRGTGEVLCAEWAMTGEAATCDLVACQETRLLAVGKERLYQLLAESRDFAEHFLARALEGKLAVQQAAGRMHSRTNKLEAFIARQAEQEYGDLLGSSRAAESLRAAVREQAARLDPLLLIGETGTGKELAAAEVHQHSGRHTEPFIVVHGSEWRADLWRDKVEVAAGGTLVLADLDELPNEALPVVGALCVRAAPDRPRLIATMTERPGAPARPPAPWHGVPSVRIPPLRDRKADIPDLARAFLRELNAAYGATDEPIGSEAMRLLISYPYLSGNVAELRGVITHAAHLASGRPILPEHLRLGVHAWHPGRPVVGIALGGGVVRGMAHIGVLQVLQAESIPIDLVAGTSVGSLIGAVFAGGFALAELERLAPTLSWPKLVGPVWPRDGILTNVKLGAFVEQLVGAKRIEDLPIGYAAVAVDRASGGEVILRQGPIGQAVRASTAIPGLFTPVMHESRELIDGGLVNNVPASVVRSMGAD
ncbi:MAG TPA: patatin-like phospholipase family protein, partial [Symbiobacteriaceae bacterium]|nr:patatin-like phospholipase family protein [Symbiobacteriaceae bacterium]